MITKEPKGHGKVRITFSMPAGIWADTVHLVGEFNNWSPTANPMQLSDNGWSVSLELDVGKAYSYRYLINGSVWYNDWRADSYEPNEFGGDNSVVTTHLLPPAPCTQQPACPAPNRSWNWRYGQSHFVSWSASKREVLVKPKES